MFRPARRLAKGALEGEIGEENGGENTNSLQDTSAGASQRTVFPADLEALLVKEPPLEDLSEQLVFGCSPNVRSTSHRR